MGEEPSTHDDSAAEKAREEQQEVEQAKEEMRRLEQEGPPEKLEDWPEGKAKYQTFGGPDGESGYEEGPTSELGPTDLRYHEDGTITVAARRSTTRTTTAATRSLAARPTTTGAT